MVKNESDLRLVQRVRAGERAAFGRIVARYQRSLMNVAWACLGSADDAADAVQDALVLAYLHLNQLRDPNRLGAWLRRLTLNACRQQVRQRKPTAPLDAIEIVMDHTQITDTRLLVEQALDCLSMETRLTVRLFYQREMSLQEIADFQEVPVTTIKSRLRDARARLRKEWETILKETITHKPDDIVPQVLQRIAAAGLLGVLPTGEERRISIEIGTPYAVTVEQWRCPVALPGLYDRLSDIAGVDAFQSLALTLRLVQILLGHFESEGGQLLDPQTRQVISLEAYFPQGCDA